MSASSAQGLKQISQWKVFDGLVRKYVHPSSSTSTDMRFSIFLPSSALSSSSGSPSRVPTLYYLSGLSCTEDTFMQKASAFRAASQHGIAIVAPDTSPRGLNIPGESENWDFGVGAGFYVNAVTEPWNKNWKMYDYVTKELPALVESHLPVSNRKSIFGHSMGGHGALICYLNNPNLFTSCSAFAPISHPSSVPWGVKAFTGYIGTHRPDWAKWDATEILKRLGSEAKKVFQKKSILVDQGTDDEFLKQQLLPEDLIAAGKEAGVEVNLRMHEGFDHGYYFIQTFIDDHIAFHSKYLNAPEE